MRASLTNFGMVNITNETEVRGYIQATIAYTDTTAKLIGTIPAGFYVSGIKVIVTEAFNDGDGNLLDIGTADTANYFANDIDITSLGQATVTEAKSGISMSTDTAVYATYIPSGSTATTGSAKVVVYIVQGV